MLTIRKQNFESQPCYCCDGVKANYSDPQYAVTYQLYHLLPDSKRHLPARVVVPRCKYCAEKMSPILPLSIGIAIIAAIGGFFFVFSDSGIVWSLVCAVIWTVAGFFGAIIILNYAFSIVYNQMESSYEIVEVLKNEFGWQTDEPKEGDYDSTFDDNAINNMLNKLVTEYGCEYGDV